MLRTAPTWLKALLLGQLVNAASSLAFFYLTLYLVDARHLTAGTAGLVTGAYGVGSIAGNVWGGSLGDRFGLRPAFGVAKAVAAVSCLAFPVSPGVLLGPLAVS